MDGRILLVEDSPGDARLIVEMLRARGVDTLRVDRAGTLQEAVARLRSHPPDAALIDLSLPDSEGLATFEAIRAAGAEVPVVVISGLDDEELASRAVRAGAQDYLVKGRFNEEILVRALRYAMERKRVERELLRAEKRFRALVEHSVDGTVVIAPDGSVTYATPNVKALLGYDPAEIVGRQALGFVTEADRKAIEAVLTESFTAPRRLIQATGRVRHRDGGFRVLEGTVRNLIDEPAIGGIVVNYRDVTAIQQVEKNLRWLSAALEQSATAVVMMDPEGRIDYVNARFTSDTGYALEEVAGKGLDHLCATPSREISRRWAEIRGGRECRMDILNRCKNGELRWHAVVISPVRDSDGQATRFLGSLTDITTRKLLEAQLSESNTRFHQVADSITELFFLASLDLTEMIYANAPYEKLTGRPLSEFFEHPTSLLPAIHPEDRERVIDTLALLRAGEQPSPTEVRIVRPDGTERWVHVQMAPIRNERGEPYRMSGVVLDITERKEMEEALRDSLLRLHKLAETTFDAIAVSKDGIYKEVNGGFLRMFGYDRESEVVGQPIARFVAPESAEEFSRRLAGAVSGTFECTGLRRDGRKILLETTINFNVSHGEPVCISAMRDITARRSLEEQFRQAQKMEAVGRLAGGVAHDFNNLLTVISGNAELLQAELPASDPRHEELQAIIKAAYSASGLTRRLLAFSRRQEVRPQPVRLAAAVAEAEKMLRRVVGEDVAFTLQLAADDATVRIDPAQVDQILMNLVVNARDAMPTGGRLTIATGLSEVVASPTLLQWECAPGSYATLTVSDTGSGMSEDTLHHIFEPFFTTKEAGKGTGLGLATVYGIVKQAGGMIDVESSPGNGSSFRIFLPLITDGDGGAGIAAPAYGAGPGAATILLVEDDADMRLVAAEALRRHGYTVLESPRASDALEVAAKPGARIDLLLTDVVMPEMNGRQLADRFQTMWPGAKVLFMTGYTDDDALRYGVSATRDTVIAKPFTPQLLASRVRDVLGDPAKRLA